MLANLLRSFGKLRGIGMACCREEKALDANRKPEGTHKKNVTNLLPGATPLPSPFRVSSAAAQQMSAPPEKKENGWNHARSRHFFIIAQKTLYNSEEKRQQKSLS